MQRYALTPHPDFPPLQVRQISFTIYNSDPNWLTTRWRLDGAGAVVVPPFAGIRRQDDLWRTTCFELFIRSDGVPACSEWNFAPSQAWAAYDFDGYRNGMSDRSITRPPSCLWRAGASDLALFDVAIARRDLPPLPWSFQATAVIEEAGGRKSYWAMQHPVGAPDFHDPACFTGRLAAPPPA